MASNLRRSKRTVGKKINDIDRRVTRMQRTPPARRIGRGVIAASNLAQNSVTYSQLTGGIATDISGAQSTADGKNAIFYSATTPTPRSSGDLWFDIDNDYALSKWNGTIWESFGLGSAAFSYIDAGKITVGTLSGREVICQETVVGLSTVTTKAQILADGTVYSKYETTGDISPFPAYPYYNEIYINKKDDQGALVIRGTQADGFTLTTTKVTSANALFGGPVAHGADARNGRFYGIGSHTNIGGGGSQIGAFRVENGVNVYEQSVTGRDVHINSSGTLGYTSSSIRYKEEVDELSVDYKDVLKIEPVTFYYRPEMVADLTYENREIEVGVIAEQVEEIGSLSHLLTYTGDQLQGFKYNRLTVYLLEVCRKQEEVIEDLKARVSALEAQK